MNQQGNDLQEKGPGESESSKLLMYKMIQTNWLKNE